MPTRSRASWSCPAAAAAARTACTAGGCRACPARCCGVCATWSSGGRSVPGQQTHSDPLHRAAAP
eukprot:1131596-Prymnesium_polylepis.2